MSTVRQDAWSEDEDLLLAETVLRHIREGSTQLTAFEEVGKTLSRTAAACGFRWNSLVRKQYDTAINLAKKQRKELQNKKKLENKKNRSLTKHSTEEKESHSKVNEAEGMNLQQIITYLESLNNDGSLLKLQNENQQLKTALEEEKIQRLNAETALNQVESEYNLIKSEYQAMLSIMERARKLADNRPNREKTKV